jgi:hypothetical protein
MKKIPLFDLNLIVKNARSVINQVYARLLESCEKVTELHYKKVVTLGLKHLMVQHVKKCELFFKVTINIQL